MYEQNTSTVTDALKSSSTATFSDETIARILALSTKDAGDTTVSIEQVNATGGAVTVTAGTELAFITSSDTQKTTLTAPVNAPVVVFQGKGGVIATFNDGPVTVPSAAGVTDRVVIHSQGADSFVIADGKNTQITIGANDTVVTGSGNDTVIAGSGNSTVIGGTGHSIVDLGGDADDYEVTVVNGHAVVTNTDTGAVTDISKIQFVQLDSGKALIFANDTLEAAVSTLYETTFGRTADAGGLGFWFDRARDGLSLAEIADAFTEVSEFSEQAARDDEAFVNSLYQNTFGRNSDAGGLEFWTSQLESGALDRGDVIEVFASAAASHLDGSSDGETTIIGSVTIISGIIG